MREINSPCPYCPPKVGRIVEVSGRRAPPKKYYNDFVGPPGPAVIRYRCNRGHRWNESGGEVHTVAS
jgi:hypothetical protein